MSDGDSLGLYKSVDNGSIWTSEEVDCDASNLASGAYIYLLKAGSYSSTKKK